MVRLLLVPLLVLLSTFAVAGSKQEIAHLLDFVEHSECSYQRNGTDHNGEDARKHIQKKYDYYAKKIKTAEDFIAYSATKSALSGKKYTINCAGKEVLFSSDWLNVELNRYREQSVVK